MSQKLCQCVKRVNEKLREYNAILETNFLDDPPRALVSVCKIAPRGKKPPKMTASFCPFCGKKYHDARRSLAKLDAPDTSHKRGGET